MNCVSLSTQVLISLNPRGMQFSTACLIFLTKDSFHELMTQVSEEKQWRQRKMLKKAKEKGYFQPGNVSNWWHGKAQVSGISIAG